MQLVAGDSMRYLAPADRTVANVLGLPSAPDLEAELDAMISDVRQLSLDMPDEVMRTCTGFLARCTEIYVRIIRVEGREREYRFLRTQQLVKVMELLDFYYKAASRFIEFRKMEMETSR